MTGRTKTNRRMKWAAGMLLALHASLCTSLAQGLPTTEGESIRYTAYIEIGSQESGVRSQETGDRRQEAGTRYVSGICVLHREGDKIHGSLFNEFGITALGFTYWPEKKKVKLHTVMKMMDKWYIRRILKKDLRQLMEVLRSQETGGGRQAVWKNERYHIVYQLTPLL